MNWKLGYAIGFHPWEDADQEFLESLTALLEREERGRVPPYGRALDIGTGSAIWGIELAKRGWEVTGVDFVAKALDRGRVRVQTAGVKMKLVQADVSQLSEAEVGSGFVVLDAGRFLSRASCSASCRRGLWFDIPQLAGSHALFRGRLRAGNQEGAA